MGYSNEPEWDPWKAIMMAVDMMTDMSRTATKNTDPFVSMGMALTFFVISPLVIVAFLLISLIWYLIRKVFYNQRR